MCRTVEARWHCPTGGGQRGADGSITLAGFLTVLGEFVQLSEEPAKIHQRLEVAFLSHAAAVEDDDAVGDAGVDDEVFGAWVHRAGRLVEHQHGGVAVERSGDRDALSLAAGEVGAAPVGAGHEGVEAVWHLRDDAVRAGRLRGVQEQGVVGGAGLAEVDVGAQVHRPARVVLRDQADPGPHAVRVGLGEVGAVPGDRATGVRDAQSGEQSGQGGLAAAVLADQRDQFALAQGEGDAVDRRGVDGTVRADAQFYAGPESAVFLYAVTGEPGADPQPEPAPYAVLEFGPRGGVRRRPLAPATAGPQ